jgi:hypothetical protein
MEERRQPFSFLRFCKKNRSKYPAKTKLEIELLKIFNVNDTADIVIDEKILDWLGYVGTLNVKQRNFKKLLQKKKTRHEEVKFLDETTYFIVCLFDLMELTFTRKSQRSKKARDFFHKLLKFEWRYIQYLMEF